MTDSDRIKLSLGTVRILAKPGYPPSVDLVVQALEGGQWEEVYRVNDMKEEFALEKAHAFATQFYRSRSEQ
jgi:hypothetical protein